MTDKPTNGLPCPHCGSSDAAGYVPEAEDVLKCFSCGKSWKETEGEAQGDASDFDDVEAPVQKDTNGLSMADGTPIALTRRGLKVETCKYFHYYPSSDAQGRPIQVSNYFSPKDNSRVAQQWRYQNKDFKMVGQKIDFFWAQHRYPKGKRVVITEGQIDCMSLWQTLGGTWPVVSLPNGAQSVKKVFSAQQEWLAQWSEIVLCFDTDEPGRAAVDEAVKLCPPGKVFIMHLPLKDVNEMLVAKREAEVRDAYWKAKKYSPAALLRSEDVIPLFLTEDPSGGTPWPWEGLNKIAYYRQPGNTYAIAAAQGAGKTDVLAEIILSDVQHGAKVGCIFLEESPAEVKAVCVAKLSEQLLHYPDCKVSREEKQDWARKFEELPGDTVWYDMIDDEGTFEDILPLVKHLVYAEGCTTIILDSATVAWDNKGDEGDSYKQSTYKAYTKAIKAAAPYGTHSIVASHLNKPPNHQQQHTEGAQIRQSHFFGSQAVPRSSAICFGVERNMTSEDETERNISTIRVVKARRFGKAMGKTAKIQYVPETGRLVDYTESDFGEETNEETEW